MSGCMDWTEKDVEAFARQILERYFCESDVEFLISTFDSEIVWLGGGEQQHAEGKDPVARFFLEGKADLLPCTLTEQRYVTRRLGPGYFLCKGEGRLQTPPSTQTHLDVIQRVTFIFHLTEEGPKTVHIHNSVPYTAIQSDELFPVKAAQDAFQKLQEQVLDQNRQLDQINRDFERQAAFLTKLYNSVPCGIIQFLPDSSHRILHANRMSWEIYGYTQDEYLYQIRDPFQLVSDEDKGRIQRYVDNLALNGENAVYTRETKRKDGSSCLLSVAMGLVTNADGIPVVQCVFTDITEITRLQEERAQEQRMENRYLRAAIYSAYAVIMTINLTKDLYRCMSGVEGGSEPMTSGSYEQLVEQTFLKLEPSFQEMFRDAFSRSEILRRFASGEREVYTELRQLGADGEYHWLSMHVIQVENPYGEDLLAVNLMKVLDEQQAEKARQEQILRDALAAAKAANNAKSDFLSRMSHDIRTPLNAIIGMGAIGRLQAGDPARVKDCFEKIDSSSQYLLSLINDILDMSKIEKGKIILSPVKFRLKELIGELGGIVYHQAKAKGLDFEIHHREPLDAYYIADTLRLNQILMNLLSNSLKYTLEGGKIQIDIWEERRINGFAYLMFQVSDTGIGMSPKFLEKLYVPFEQENSDAARNYVGTGLGLSIVYNLVQLMGGEINVRSEKGSGTEFTVCLPFRLATLREAEEQERKARERLKDGNSLVADDDAEKTLPAYFQGQRVLLAEDNLLNLEIAQSLLEMRGLTVDTAVNGEAALKKFRQSAPGHYLAVLMDIRMPVLDGLAATRLIRALERPDAKTIPILAMSANAFEEDKAAALTAGMNDYLVKPVDITVLLDTLNRYLK